MNSHTIETYAKATFLALLITTILIAKLVIYILDRRSLRQTDETLRSLLNSRYSDVTLHGEKGVATFFHERRHWKVISDFFLPMGRNRFGQEVPLPDQYRIPRTTLSVQIYAPAPDGQADGGLNFRLKRNFTYITGPDGGRQPMDALRADTESQELRRLLEGDAGLKRLVCPSDADSLLDHCDGDVVELKNGWLTIVRHVHLTTPAKAEKFFNMATGIFQKIRDLAEEQMGGERFSQLDSALDSDHGGARRDDWIYDEADPDSHSTASPADGPEVMDPERGIEGRDPIAGYLDGAQSSQSLDVIPEGRSRNLRPG